MTLALDTPHRCEGAPAVDSVSLTPPRRDDSARESPARFDFEHPGRVDDVVPRRDVVRGEELEPVEIEEALVLVLGGR